MKICKLKRIDTDSGRAYVLNENGTINFLPSVTTVLSLKPSSYLADLEKEIGKEKLIQIGKCAALRGTAMHAFLENYLICLKNKGNRNTCLLYTQRKTTDSLLNEMERDRINAGRSLFYNIYHSNVLDNIKKIVFSEKFLYSKSNLFAGTADFCFIDINGSIVIVDFKSASGEKDADTIDKYKCQIAAYVIAFEELFQKHVDRGEIWISYDDKLQVEVLSGGEMENKKLEFIDLCKKYHEMWDIAPFELAYLRDI